MPSLPSDPFRKPPSPIRGLFPGALCGALIGFFGFGPASYVYHSVHEGRVVGGKEFFGYHWAAHTPFEHARDHAVGFGLLSSLVGAVWGLVLGERARREPIGSRTTYLVAVLCFGFGLLHGFTLSSKLDHFVEGPVVSSIFAATMGYAGASLFRYWVNSDLKDQEQANDCN